MRLRRETEITAILEHPNIIPLNDMQQVKGELQFTMRKVEGITFKTILDGIKEKEEKFDENKLLSIFLKVCDGYAHS